MERFEYHRGPAGPIRVEVHDDRLAVHTGRQFQRSETVWFSDLKRLRHYLVPSPQRQHWGLALETASEKQLVEYVEAPIGDAASAPVFADVIDTALQSIGAARPDLPVTRGVDPFSRWVIFLAFALPAAMALLLGLAMVMSGDTMGVVYGLVSLGLGGLSLAYAWTTRPWRSAQAMTAATFLNSDRLTGMLARLRAQRPG